MPILNAGILKGLNIQVPPIELQSKFIATLEKITRKAEKLVLSKLKSEKLFNSLNQQAFRGELSKQTEAA
jgi:type I restriction enzyme S subunit